MIMANKKNQRKARGERARASCKWRVNTRIKVNRKPVHREMKTARVGGTRWRPRRARAALEPKPMAARNPKRMASPIYFCATLRMMEPKIDRPSVPPIISSQQRSGWGIMPRTLPARLVMPAMLFREPLGLEAGVASPSGVA